MRRYTPLNFPELNMIEGTYTPSCVKSMNNAAFMYWERALFQRACSVIDFKLPDNWRGGVRDFFYYVMFKVGFCSVFDDKKFGKIFQPASLTGYDVFYQPTDAIIANPAFRSKKLKIGTECAILKLTPDYMGVWDIITYYAQKLALLDNAINISLINNKYGFMLFAKNKAASEAFKKALDQLNEGIPAIVMDRKVANDPNDKSEPWQFWNRGNLKESYLTSDQLRDFHTILNDFDCEIGIPVLPEEKKERMITDEATMRVNDAMSRSGIWLDTFNSSAEIANKLFGLDIKASLNYKKGEPEDAEQTDIDRDV